MYGDMSERVLEQNVRRAAALAGWLYYHTYDSRRSDPGFPDCFMTRDGVVIVRELKTQKGRLTLEQSIWVDALRAAGIDAGIWRPFDWGDGTITKELE